MGKVPVSPPRRILGPDGEIITIIDMAGPRSSTAFGGEGDDTILASGANDTVSGGGGIDLLLIKGIPGTPINLNDPLQGGSVDSIDKINHQQPDPPFVLNVGGNDVLFIDDEEAREKAFRDAFRFGGNVINSWTARLEQANRPRGNWIFG
jgi:hypothetical protein